MYVCFIFHRKMNENGVKVAANRCSSTNEQNLAILTMIRDKKDILFGKFSSELENATKIETWSTILEKAKSMQMVTASRDWTWIRDNLYSVWKTRAFVRTWSYQQIIIICNVHAQNLIVIMI